MSDISHCDRNGGAKKASTTNTAASSTPATPLRDRGGESAIRRRGKTAKTATFSMGQFDDDSADGYRAVHVPERRGRVADYVNLLLEMSRFSSPSPLCISATSRISVSPRLWPCLFVQREIRAQRWKPRWVGFAATATAPAPSIQDRKAIVFRAVPKIAAPSVRFF